MRKKKGVRSDSHAASCFPALARLVARRPGAGTPEALVPVSQGATCWHWRDSSGHLPGLQPRPGAGGRGPGLKVQVGLQVPAG